MRFAGVIPDACHHIEKNVAIGRLLPQPVVEYSTGLKGCAIKVGESKRLFCPVVLR
jgi:hypothetical protein